MRFPAVPDSEIVYLFTIEHLTYRQIAARYGMSHAAVGKRLKRAGVSADQGEHVQVKCARCGEPLDRTRARVRKALRMYCSKECYFATRENPAFIEWRHGGHIARALVAKHFALEREHIVHHKNTNQRDNALGNLQVFASQSDHSAHHHGRSRRALWDGATCRCPRCTN